MLKYKIKKQSKNKPINEEIFIDPNINIGGDDQCLLLTTSENKPHLLNNSDYITVTFNDDEILYSEIFNTTIENINTFGIVKPSILYNTISELSNNIIIYSFDGEGRYSIKTGIILTLNNRHFFGKGHIVNSDEIEIIETNENTLSLDCADKYVSFNGFLYKVINNNNGKLQLNDKYENTDKISITIVNGKENFVLENGIIPLNDDAIDDEFKIIYFYNNENKAKLDYVTKHFDELTVQYADNRFFNENNGNFFLKKRFDGTIGVQFYKIANDFALNLNLFDNFSPIYDEDQIVNGKFGQEVIENSINEIVDYEKRPFSPVFINNLTYIDGKSTINDSDLRPIKEIEFNLHFRKRTNEYSSSGDIVKEWVTNDTLYWNNYTMGDNGLISTIDGVTNYSNYDTFSDLLSYLNYTDDDVYYQKSKLSKSFIRLSFYDTRDRATQSLLFYSTIFLDSGRLYTKYIRNKSLNTKVSENSNECVSDEHITTNGGLYDDDRLSTRITCHDMYDYLACSEGFYLYLFPDIVSGNTWTPIYMKVEFNHAKYGRTIPFTMPTYNSGSGDNSWLFGHSKNTPINGINNEKFPFHYLNLSENKTVNGVNIERLNNDTYIKLYVKYDFNRCCYVWMLPRQKDQYNGDNEDSKIIFNLWEPRINGTEHIEKDNSSGSDDKGTYLITVKGLNFLDKGNLINIVLKSGDSILFNQNISPGTDNMVTATTDAKLSYDKDGNVLLDIGLYKCIGDAVSFKAMLSSNVSNGSFLTVIGKSGFSTHSNGAFHMSKLKLPNSDTITLNVNIS